MKQMLLYCILFGMVLIHVPKEMLHDCSHEIHHCDNEKKDGHSEQNHEGALFEEADCDLCLYTFQAINTPDFELISIPKLVISQQTFSQEKVICLGSRSFLQLRGPPQIVKIAS